MATVEALVNSGAHVIAWDNREDARQAMVGMAEIADPLAIDLSGFDGVVVSPGVPLNRHPIADKAREAGVPIIGDIELFALARPSLPKHRVRSEEHTPELQSLMRLSYAVFCLKKNTQH